MVHLLRASAGAGKTHQLVQIYLRYILASPSSISEVVVLSFTNKATEELKQRILMTLFELSEGKKATAMSIALKSFLNEDEAGLQERAGKALAYLLTHYDEFSINTIDAFFQKLLRPFSYELDLPSTYELLIEEDKLLDSCIETFFQRVPSTPILQEMLTDLAIDQMAEGKAWHFKKVLKSWGKDLLMALGSGEGSWKERNLPFSLLLEMLKGFSKEAKELSKTLATKAEVILQTIKKSGFEVEDFTWGERGVIGFLKKIARKEKIVLPSRRIIEASEDPALWVSKHSIHRDEILLLVKSNLQPLLYELVTYLKNHYKRYVTVKTLLPLRYRLVTNQQLKELILSYARKHEVVLMHKVPLLVREIFEKRSTDFLYAKTGKKFTHLLIDESQDLSTMQWRGLAALIEQIISKGGESYLVGDVKQAIYRWRGGNPKLLLKGVEETIGKERTLTSDLRYNWRSGEMIVGFNNAFFGEAVNLVMQELRSSLPAKEEGDVQPSYEEIASIGEAYGQVAQLSPESKKGNKGEEGYVEVAFINGEGRGNGWKQEAIQRTIERVELLQKKGYPPGDITLLVRRNGEARELLHAFLQYASTGKQREEGICYEVVANAALGLADHPHIKLLLATLAYLNNSSDQVALATLVHLYQHYIKGFVPVREGESPSTAQIGYDYFLAIDDIKVLENYLPKDFFLHIEKVKRLPLYPLIARIIELLGMERVEIEAYLDSFKEVVHTFSLRKEGGVSAFLDWWEKNGEKEVAFSPTKMNAIQVMTVHQAKGLTFKAVIMPFCTWAFDHTAYNAPVIRGATHISPFDQLGEVLLRYGKQLREGYYVEAYGQERWQHYLEQLNLLYVALTRASELSYLFTPRLGEGGVKTVGHLLNTILFAGVKGEEGLLSERERWDEEMATWSIGTFPSKDLKPLQRHRHLSEEVAERFAISPKQYEGVTSRILAGHERGIWWHDLFGEITTMASIDPLLEGYVKSGRISPERAIEVRGILDDLFEDKRLRDWFSGRWEVFQERTIVLPSGAVWRPDRVMVSGKKAVVLDFKAGQRSSSHQKQVGTYMDLMKKLGYKEVEGYLLYLSERQLVLV